VLGHGICTNPDIWGVGYGGDGDRLCNKPVQKSICQLPTVCIYLASGDFAPDPYQGSAPGPHRSPGPALTSEPGYTTGDYTDFDFCIFLVFEL